MKLLGLKVSGTKSIASKIAAATPISKEVPHFRKSAGAKLTEILFGGNKTPILFKAVRTRSFDYAWRIAIIAGGVVYVLMIIAGGFYFRLDIDVVTLIIYTVISVVIGLLLEFFVFGGDYTRTERLEYEDDEYYYYVKAVPKACVTTSERSIKKISGSSAKDERPAQDNVVSYANPIFHGDEKAVTTDEAAAPVERKKDIDSVDFEKKLEESLKNL